MVMTGRGRLKAIGLMSGTSADGIDAALVEIDPAVLFGFGQETEQGRGAADSGALPAVVPQAAARRRGLRLLAYREEPYPDAVRQPILQLCSPETGRVDDICRWNFALGEAFAAAALRLLAEHGISPDEVDLIASHGQTVYHIPKPEQVGPFQTRSTLQIGEPAVIAERTGITTVADFRVRDMAAGGQGAPLIAYFDALLYFDPGQVLVLQNVGGIGNATCLPGQLGQGAIFAFDTGPGNMVIDAVVAALSGGQLRFDRDGEWAAQGETDRDLVQELLQDPYFFQAPPKTTGREYFGPEYVRRLLDRAAARGLTPADTVATATLLTAASIVDQYRRWILPRTGGRLDRVLVTGGGSYNRTLVRMFEQEMAGSISGTVAIEAPLEDEWPAGAKEAIGFAVLGAATLLGIANNLPAATGAAHPAVLGVVVPGRGGHEIRWQAG